MPASRPEPTILLVDDDTAARGLVAMHLRRENFDVVEAASGEAALELMAGQAIGLVILDMGLPGMSGLDVVMALREQARTATVPIVVLTGRGVDYPLATSLGVGADDYLTKPIRLDDLAARVRTRLRSQRVATEQAVREREDLYRELVEESGDGILVSDASGRYVEVNPALCRMLGYSREEVLGMQAGDLTADDDPVGNAGMDARLVEAADEAGILVARRYRKSDGTSLPVEVRFKVLRDGRQQRNVRDITERKQAEAEREREAQIRIALAESLATIPRGASAEREAQAICDALVTLPFVDVATIQVFLGGDDVEILAQSAPPGYPAMAGTHLSPAQAAIVRERSAGGQWARYAESETADGGLRTAEVPDGLKALASGPIAHGGQVRGALVLGTFDEAHARTLVEQMPGLASFSATSSALLGARMQARQEERDLRFVLEGVLAAGAFHPVFQPIVDLDTGETMGYEALTRFDSGQRPDLCFADAWLVGLGPEMELATLRAAVDAGSLLPAGTWLDLNVSPGLLADPGRVRAILRTADRALVLEVTEHDLVGDYEALRAAIRELGRDIRLAVDDAGAGIANFGHIIDLRPDFVKLDISLVRRVNANLGRQAMVVGMRHFSRTAGCRLIAEGVETAEEARTLTDLGVEFGQGYLYGRPAPAADWTAARAAAPEPSQLALPVAQGWPPTRGRTSVVSGRGLLPRAARSPAGSQ